MKNLEDLVDLMFLSQAENNNSKCDQVNIKINNLIFKIYKLTDTEINEVMSV